MCALVLAAAAAVLPPAAAAEQLHANVVSWAHADVKVGQPVSVVLVLYGGGPRLDGVEVVIRGNETARRFATTALGSARYRTEIVFPSAGSWRISVGYPGGSYGGAGEIPLGKGGIRIDAPTADRTGRAPPSTAPATVVILALALALSGLALAASRSASRGSPARPG